MCDPCHSRECHDQVLFTALVILLLISFVFEVYDRLGLKLHYAHVQNKKRIQLQVSNCQMYDSLQEHEYSYSNM